VALKIDICLPASNAISVRRQVLTAVFCGVTPCCPLAYRRFGRTCLHLSINVYQTIRFLCLLVPSTQNAANKSLCRQLPSFSRNMLIYDSFLTPLLFVILNVTGRTRGRGAPVVLPDLVRSTRRGSWGRTPAGRDSGVSYFLEVNSATVPLLTSPVCRGTRRNKGDGAASPTPSKLVIATRTRRAQRGDIKLQNAQGNKFLFLFPQLL
jgi:hypothetical protein